MQSATHTPERIVRPREAAARVGYSAMHIYRLEQAGTFPRRFKLSPNGGRNGAVGWLESDLAAWLAERAASRIPAAE